MAAKHIIHLHQSLGTGPWSYTGQVIDHGPGAAEQVSPPRCVCGHPVRYQFVVRAPDGREQRVGSKCIDLVPGLEEAAREAMRAEAKRLEREARREAARARRAEKERHLQEEIDRLAEELDRVWFDLRELYADYRLRRRRAPYRLWWWRNKARLSPRARTLSAQLRWYRETVAEMKEVVEEAKQWL